jgi:hypothetical protein
MRNLYLNYIREHPFLKHFDVLAVADLDLHYITVTLQRLRGTTTCRSLE